MKGKIFHSMVVPVREALAADDSTLAFFLNDGKLDAEQLARVRADLVVRLAKGHRMVSTCDCSNFDPMTGCRGHSADEIVQQHDGRRAPDTRMM